MRRRSACATPPPTLRPPGSSNSPLSGGSLQDQGNYELFLSATFLPPVVSNTVVIQDTADPKLPDPLADLRAGKRPKATIAGGTVKISKRGVGKIKITNPNGYALKGSFSLVAGNASAAARKLKLGKGKVSLAANATKAFKFKLSRKALRRLRKKRRLRATLVAKLKGPIGKTATIRKKLTLKAPPKPRRKKRKRRSGGGGSGNLWVARNGTTGAYDDFKFRLDGSTINITGTSLLFVSCFEIGGSYRSRFSYEVFNLLGPVAAGQPGRDAEEKEQGRERARLVGRAHDHLHTHVQALRQQDHGPAEDELHRLAVRPVQQHDLVHLLLGHPELRGDSRLSG